VIIPVIVPLCGPGDRFVLSVLTETDGPYPLADALEPSIEEFPYGLIVNQPVDVDSVTAIFPEYAPQFKKDMAPVEFPL
jgi:hypothetical protein